MNSQIALSYCRDDAWIAKDLHALLSWRGFSVFNYNHEPDSAHGFLRTQLTEFYTNSYLNIMVWSRPYVNQPRDSIVAGEKRDLAYRHVQLGEDNSLFIICVDDTPRDQGFERILAHSHRTNGITGLYDLIIKRLGTLFAQKTDYGAINHPPGVEPQRGQLKPCSFTIDPSYQDPKNKRWSQYADVLVNYPDNIHKTPYVYLIPSGLTSPLLRQPLRLKFEAGLLETRRKATVKFAEGRPVAFSRDFGSQCTFPR